MYKTALTSSGYIRATRVARIGTKTISVFIYLIAHVVFLVIIRYTGSLTFTNFHLPVQEINVSDIQRKSKFVGGDKVTKKQCDKVSCVNEDACWWGGGVSN
jgi:hypothetical protein